MNKFLYYITFAVVICAASASPKGCPKVKGLSQCKKTAVNVRLPPTLDSQPEKSRWLSTPKGWLLGNWVVTATSQPTYRDLVNFQYDSSLIVPQSKETPGQLHDVTSWQEGNSSTIHTAYGVDTPRRSTNKTLGAEWNDVYDFSGTGSLNGTTSSWEVMAWGCDTCGIEYVVIYESATAADNAPAGLDIQSRADTGPSADTLNQIYTSIKNLNNKWC
ncbi:hypothetical protein C8Q75DRAFT_734847 [Abortiporus biennis]|nr:hypothetical protein C8Q75DRAFT_734847 [Abortiporus biennis]